MASPTAPALAADLRSTLAAPNIAECLALAGELRDTDLGGTLLRPNLRNLAPRDALRYEEKRAELRERGLLDDQNKLTRRGRIVQGCL